MEGQWRAAAGRPEPVRSLFVSTGEEEIGAVPDVVLVSRPDCFAAATALSAAAHAPLVWAGPGPPPGPVHAARPPGTPLALRELALTPYRPL